MDQALSELKDFMYENNAVLPEGDTFDLILENVCKPVADKRKEEAKALIGNSLKYLEDFDDKMNEVSKNIGEFFKDLGTKFDENRKGHKDTEMQFNISLAQCGDHHDDILSDQEKILDGNIEEMRKAIHHVELNQKLEECFSKLDQITKTYRLYNEEYMKSVNNYPNTIETFYEKFERESSKVFKLFHEEKKEEIQALFQKETEDRQKALEAEALVKWQEEQKLEEQKQAEEEKSNPKAKKPPAKKGKDAEPQLDVAQLEVPEINEFTSSNGYKYLVERSIDEIAEKLTQIKKDEEEEKKEGEGEGDQPVEAEVPPPAEDKPAEEAKEGEGEGEGEEEKEEPQPDPIMEGINQYPPVDPEGSKTLKSDLIIMKEEIATILNKTMGKMFEWINGHKTDYIKKMEKEQKDLNDNSITELDDNLRRQWPRKGKLEVEVYQERKSQITAHNKKYERQVRVCLEKHANSEDLFAYLVENIESEMNTFTDGQGKIKEVIPDCKNLAELQGASRKEKDAVQTFDEKMRDMTE